MDPNTETLDKLYLEWSHFTKARTLRENMAANLFRRLLTGDAAESFRSSLGVAEDVRSWIREYER